MSKLDRLQITGIRAFDNGHAENIKFYTPVTLIVGYNGSGKTTIIECLKYAASGDMPPNATRNQAFIHDPNLCGEKTVLAQVRLSFHNVSGAEMTCTRSMQLESKRHTRTLKTLDGSLVFKRNAERTAFSGKVAHLNKLVPEYMGVSKAILENVVFCHQEDSLWPLSDSLSLKKKFDEIFAAQRYTKAVDNIKIIRKNQSTELKQLQIHENHAKEAKHKGETMRKRQADLDRDITTIKTDVQNLSERVKVVESKAKEAWDKCAHYEALVLELQNKRKEAQSRQSNIEELKLDMGAEMTESDQELQVTVDQYDETVKFYQQQKDTQTKRYNELSEEWKKLRSALDQKHADHGRFEADQKHYDERMAERTELVQELAQRHNIRGFAHGLTEDQVREFMDKIGRMAREQQSNFDKAKREVQEELQRVQQILSDLNGRKSALNQSKENTRKQISVNDTKIASQRQILDQLEFDEGIKARYENNVQEAESRLMQKRKDFDTTARDEQIKNATNEIQSFEDKARQLQDELIISTAHANESVKYNFLKESLKESRNSLDTMMSAHATTLSEAFGPDWSSENLENQFYQTLSRLTSDLKSAEADRDGSVRTLEQLEFRLQSARTEAKSNKEERKKLHHFLQDILDADPSEYAQVRETLQKNRDTHISEIENSKNMAKFFSGSLEYLQKHKGCRLCERPFDDSKDRQKFEAKLARMINQDIREFENDLKATVADLEKVEAAFSSHQSWKRLEAEIKNADNATKELETSRNQLVTKIEGQDTKVDHCRLASKELESLSKTVQNITKYQNDMVKFEQQLNDHSAKQPQTGVLRAHDEINEEIKTVDKELVSQKSNLTRLTAERDRARDQINSLELDVRDLKTKLNTAMQQLREKGAIDSTIKDLQDSNKEHRATMSSVDDELQNIAPEISKVQTQYDEISLKGDEKERHLRDQANQTMNSINSLHLADKDIKAFIANDGHQQLQRSHRELEDLRRNMEQITNEQQNVTSAAKKTEDALNNQEKHRRRITDNLRYRRETRALHEIRAEINRLENENAEKDRDRYQREANKFEAERQGLHAKQQHLTGQLKSMDGQLAGMLEDWDKEYKFAPERYREAHINVETSKAAIEDLGRYGNALDKAIMTYHSTKMEEINRIIEELWKSTYRGTDVDTILIKSDNEDGKGTKNYKYRVCMVKQDVEMEMRGRCSAGQKVLASIIIRLALAECFGVSCGIIALDEPTTNLDRDNIASLGRSLAAIIKARQAQKNFQLIVITHDEQFLRDMNATEYCDYYYRVTRDGRQKSQIERQRIGDIMA